MNQRLSPENQPPERGAEKVGFLSPANQLPARLQEVIGEESVTSFGRRCGIGESVLRKYLAGAVPSADRLVAIADTGNVSIEWLAAGRGPKLRRDLQAVLAAPTPAAAPAPSVGEIDLQDLEMAIAAVEEGLAAIRRVETPTKKAKLVMAAYDLINLADEDEGGVDLVQLVQLIKRSA